MGAESNTFFLNVLFIRARTLEIKLFFKFYTKELGTLFPLPIALYVVINFNNMRCKTLRDYPNLIFTSNDTI